ncbi:transcriptional repressor [Kineosporia sp. J2-2]|uniref:Transcriptional repressor n=1 Tax=Kineosporia corallincola TaxID=2835133 RepID=A0ABS5TNB7_9ACTN|nr:Fur family transcriptional regulator [Kineosporia corallincola]MBT0772594.1 transcriptional repressor [Kineosporia corallincola]
MTDPTVLLRGAGLRSTAPRRAVLEALITRPHSTVTDLSQAVDGQLSNQTIYNALDDLANSGLVRRIEPAGSATRYETRVGDNHHHLVCRSCGVVADVDCHTGEAPCLTPASSNGFARVDEAEVVWWGICNTCAARPQG